MESILPWIIKLGGGALGGNVFGAIFKKLSLGGLGNSLAGILGGGIGGTLLNQLGIGAAANSGMDLGSILSNVGASGAGGGVFMLIIGMIKKVMGK